MHRVIQHGNITTVALYHEEDDLYQPGGKEVERATFVTVRHEDDSYILKVYTTEKFIEYKLSQLQLRTLGVEAICLLDSRLFELEHGPSRYPPAERGLDDARRSEEDSGSPEATDSTRPAATETGYEDNPY